MTAAIESFMMFTTGVHLRYVNDPIVVSHRIKIFVDSRLLCWLLTTTERFGSSEFSYWTIRKVCGQTRLVSYVRFHSYVCQQAMIPVLPYRTPVGTVTMLQSFLIAYVQGTFSCSHISHGEYLVHKNHAL